MRNLLPAVGFLLFVFACHKNPATDPNDNTLLFEKPEHFPEPVYTFENNPLSREGFELGRKLFYEPLLSVNGTISCGSCHHQAEGFSDAGKAFSTGTDQRKGLRNSPALSNLAWYPAFMMDGGINHIEVMPIAPITDSLEMAEELTQVLAKLQAHPEYPGLFKAAFNNDKVTTQNMLYALAQFMAMMVSHQSRFDQFLQGKIKFSPAESKGYFIFEKNCAGCHAGPLLTDFSYRNNGLDAHSADPGRARITQKPGDHGKFKVPNLRNVALSPPYMHDGRFNSLEEVIDHYSEGIVANPNLDSTLSAPLQLSSAEKSQLLEFLKTLTDFNYIHTESLSDPNP